MTFRGMADVEQMMEDKPEYYPPLDPIRSNSMKFVKIIDALKNTRRVSILETCLKNEQSQEDLARLHKISQPSISNHIKQLTDAGLLEVRVKDGKKYYITRFQKIVLSFSTSAP